MVKWGWNPNFWKLFCPRILRERGLTVHKRGRTTHKGDLRTRAQLHEHGGQNFELSRMWSPLHDRKELALITHLIKKTLNEPLGFVRNPVHTNYIGKLNRISVPDSTEPSKYEFEDSLIWNSWKSQEMNITPKKAKSSSRPL